MNPPDEIGQDYKQFRFNAMLASGVRTKPDGPSAIYPRGTKCNVTSFGKSRVPRWFLYMISSFSEFVICGIKRRIQD